MGNNGISPRNADHHTLKKMSRKAQWEEAAKDTALPKDICDIEADFLVAHAETAKRLDD